MFELNETKQAEYCEKYYLFFKICMRNSKVKEFINDFTNFRKFSMRSSPVIRYTSSQ